MTEVLAASIGALVLGPLGAALGVSCPIIWRRMHRPAQRDPSATLVMLLLLVELRSGKSVLASLLEVARSLPHDVVMSRVARVATVSGLTPAVAYADERLRPLLTQLARAQRTGASLSGVVRRMLDAKLASDRAERIARSRSLPVRLMLPVTLLMLPGLVLLLYAPSLLAMFEDLIGVLG